MFAITIHRSPLSRPQILMNELHRRCAFPDSGCHAFDRTVSHISGHKNSRLAGFQPEWIAIKCPADVPITFASRKIRSGKYESVIIELDDILEPAGVWQRANENE